MASRGHFGGIYSRLLKTNRIFEQFIISPSNYATASLEVHAQSRVLGRSIWNNLFDITPTPALGVTWGRVGQSYIANNVTNRLLLWGSFQPWLGYDFVSILCPVVLRAYLFLINTYKHTTWEEMYLFVLISAKMCLKCTYFAQKSENFEIRCP